MRGAADLVLAATSSPVVAGSALVAYGTSTSTAMIAYQSTLQTEIPDRLRGRAFALFDVLWNAARLVSLGLGGLVADAVDIRSVSIAGGLLLFLTACYGATAPLAKPLPSQDGEDRAAVTDPTASPLASAPNGGCTTSAS